MYMRWIHIKQSIFKHEKLAFSSSYLHKVYFRFVALFGKTHNSGNLGEKRGFLSYDVAERKGAVLPILNKT